MDNFSRQSPDEADEWVQHTLNTKTFYLPNNINLLRGLDEQNTQC